MRVFIYTYTFLLRMDVVKARRIYLSCCFESVFKLKGVSAHSFSLKSSWFVCELWIKQMRLFHFLSE